MDIGQLILETIRNPDVAYVLLILGLFSAVLAFAVPGTVFAEVAAGICLLLAIIGLSQMRVDLAGLTLILLGVGLFIIDLKFQSGAVAAGGALVLGIGSLFLFEVSATQPAVSLWLILIVTIGSLAFFGFGINRAMKAMRMRPKVAMKNIIGSKGVVRAELTVTNGFTGIALIDSELWTVTASESLPMGTPVVVDQAEGLVLHVHKGDSN